MRKIIDKEKYVARYIRLSRKQQKRRLRLREKNILLRKSLQSKPKASQVTIRQRQRERKVVAPATFSFVGNPTGVANFLLSLEHCLHKRLAVFVNMSQVSKIDYEAITALLAVMYNFKMRNIGFNGNFPQDKETKVLLMSSGFLYHLFETNQENKAQYRLGQTNQLVTNVGRILDMNLVDVIIGDVANTIWGEKKPCPALYNILCELISNTNTHAGEVRSSEGTERWWLSINHDPKHSRVGFVFLDYGVGIFESLSRQDHGHPVRRLVDMVIKKAGPNAFDEQLRTIVTTRSRQTSSNKEGRGWGIYRIHQRLLDKEISSLTILSNRAYGRVHNNVYAILESNFQGTLFSWDLCYDCAI